MSSLHSLDLLAWLSQLDDAASQWQIHKAQITHSLLSQDLPIQLIYHYEKLDDDIKAKYPLNGTLLKQFSTLMTRAEFVQRPEVAGLTLDEIATPWQLKFTGKLVIFTQNPEVAIRLWWTNTLKEFELVYSRELETAIEKSFHHWQFVDSVEVICKTPNVLLTAQPNEDNLPWQLAATANFVTLPAVIGLAIQKILNDNEFVKTYWLPVLIDLAKQQMVTD